MKILDFKSVSPLFEMERDGEKPFTFRKINSREKKHRTLAQWGPDCKWGIRITNPATGENFIREIRAVDYTRYLDISTLNPHERIKIIYGWRMIILGPLVK